MADRSPKIEKNEKVETEQKQAKVDKARGPGRKHGKLRRVELIYEGTISGPG